MTPFWAAPAFPPQGPWPHRGVNPAEVLIPHEKETYIFLRNSLLLILAMYIVSFLKPHGSQS